MNISGTMDRWWRTVHAVVTTRRHAIHLQRRVSAGASNTPCSLAFPNSQLPLPHSGALFAVLTTSTPFHSEMANAMANIDGVPRDALRQERRLVTMSSLQLFEITWTVLPKLRNRDLAAYSHALNAVDPFAISSVLGTQNACEGCFGLPVNLAVSLCLWENGKTRYRLAIVLFPQIRKRELTRVQHGQVGVGDSGQRDVQDFYLHR